MKNWLTQSVRLFAATSGPGIVGWRGAGLFYNQRWAVADDQQEATNQSPTSSQNIPLDVQPMRVKGTVKDVFAEDEKWVAVLELSLPQHSVRCEFLRQRHHTQPINTGEEIVVSGVCAGVSLQLLLQNCEANKVCD